MSAAMEVAISIATSGTTSLAMAVVMSAARSVTRPVATPLAIAVAMSVAMSVTTAVATAVAMPVARSVAISLAVAVTRVVWESFLQCPASLCLCSICVMGVIFGQSSRYLSMIFSCHANINYFGPSNSLNNITTSFYVLVPYFHHAKCYHEPSQ